LATFFIARDMGKKLINATTTNCEIHNEWRKRGKAYEKNCNQ
jgi:hypothetical protein